ncbi:MAG: glycosyltransferase family 2 protein [Pseudomonadota bacterium]
MIKSVSCTIMVYNEERTLVDAVSEVHGALSELKREFEILVVDDGSTDRSAEIARSLEQRYAEVKLLRHPKNLGPGSAILTGIRNSRKDIICFHPADQQVDFRQIASLLPLLDEHDLVVCSRSGRPGYTMMRRLASQTYIQLARRLFGLGDYDDFNFIHLYRRELLESMPIQSDGVFMCTEILVRALDSGARVARAQADCHPRRVGVSACFRPRVIAKTLIELSRFLGQRLGAAHAATKLCRTPTDRCLKEN